MPGELTPPPPLPSGETITALVAKIRNNPFTGTELDAADVIDALRTERDTLAGQVANALQADVWDWINTTFEPINRPRCYILKAQEEIRELARDETLEEAADVAICLMAYCACRGASLGDLVADKMRRNRARTDWTQDDNGVGIRQGKVNTLRAALAGAGGQEAG